jgi:hypothetical protein
MAAAAVDLPRETPTLACVQSGVHSVVQSDVPGQLLIPQFVSEEEERQLRALVDEPSPAWVTGRVNGPTRCEPGTNSVCIMPDAVVLQDTELEESLPPLPRAHASHTAAVAATANASARPHKLMVWHALCRGKRWGVRVDLASRTVSPATVPLPPALATLAARMRARVRALAAFRPNEANAIDYRRSEGHYLLPHVDDRCAARRELCSQQCFQQC